MGKRKTVPVITMYREVLPNGMIYLSSDKGIIDTRNDAVYSEVICNPKDERFFKEVED